MSADGHSEGVERGKFCAVRTGSDVKCTCDSPNSHTKNSSLPAGKSLGVKERFWQAGYLKKTEAHHLLCVASVTEFLAKREGILRVIRKTRWCINAKPNMLAMPVWGHTVKHYVVLGSGNLRRKPTAPPFADIPQHDYNHNSTGGYKSETDDEMKTLAKQVEKLKKAHKEPEAELAGKLDAASARFQRRLLGKSRGKRHGGTHEGWLMGSKDPESSWYLPFSMADTGNTEKRVFPAKGVDSNGKLADKIAALAESLKKWG